LLEKVLTRIGFEEQAGIDHSRILWVAVDVSKRQHEACFGKSDRVFRQRFVFSNHREGLRRFEETIARERMRGGIDLVVIGMEPTGPYWKPLFAQLKEHGYAAVLVHSKAVKHNRKTMGGNDGKTDRLDTLCIWDLLRQGKCFAPIQREEKLEAAYRMMHHYEDSCKRSGQIRNQLRSILALVFPELNERFKKLDGKTALAFLAKNPTPKSIRRLGPKRFLQRWRGQHGRWGHEFFAEVYGLAKTSIGVQDRERSFEVEIRFLVEELRQALETQERWFELALGWVEDHPHFALLTSIKGIGKKIATGLLASLGDPTRFDHGKQWVSLAGLDLKLHESGDSIHRPPRISRQGKGLLRYWLYLAAVILIRYPGPFRDLYLRRQKSSPGRGAKKRALIAVSDKLVRVIFAMLRDGKLYNPQADQEMEARYTQFKKAA
jgi:transposase